VHVERNIGARSCNHCCSGRAIRWKISNECSSAVFIVLVENKWMNVHRNTTVFSNCWRKQLYVSALFWVSTWWRPTKKRAETCSCFLQQFEYTVVLRRTFIHLISSSIIPRTLRLSLDLLCFGTSFIVWQSKPTTTFRKLNLFPPSVEQMGAHLPIWVRRK
jgi:hypothetical protein